MKAPEQTNQPKNILKFKARTTTMVPNQDTVGIRWEARLLAGLLCSLWGSVLAHLICKNLFSVSPVPVLAASFILSFVCGFIIGDDWFG